MELGTHVRVIANGYMPPCSTGPGPAMKSHDGVCILKATARTRASSYCSISPTANPPVPTRSMCPCVVPATELRF